MLTKLQVPPNLVNTPLPLGLRMIYSPLVEPLSHLTSREAAHGSLVNWRKITQRMRCDECLAIQHEHQGQSVMIAPARIMRTANNASLYLCWVHADAWKARDRDE